MLPVGKPAVRSLHGCWTCRVRRKKCDEYRPVCAACASLELECHGYGARPSWMDNGPLQKEMALRFKQIVCQTKSKKGRQRAHSSVVIAQSPHDSPSSGQADTTAKMDGLQGCTTVPLVEMCFQQMHDINMRAMADSTGWASAPPSDILVSESASSYYAGANDYSPPSSTTLYHNMESASSSISPASYANMTLPEDSNLVGFPDADVSWGDILSEFDDFLETAFQKNNTSTDGSLNGNPMDWHAGMQGSRPLTPSLCAAATAPLSAWQQPANEQVHDEEAEDVIFMHFLDDVFYLQYPFYQSRDGRERGWLFSILRRVKPAYYATLAQSERHFLATVPHNRGIASSLTQRRAGTTYYDLAIHGMHYIMAGFNGGTSLVQSVEALTSLLQLLFLEGFTGGTKNWKNLLRAAATLVPALVNARSSTCMPEPSDRGCALDRYRQSGVSPELGRACCVLLGSFISFDIIAAASTRGERFLDVDHVGELAGLGTPVQSMMGCRNSVMALICEITALDRWKRENQVIQKLSIVDLVKRGAKIEERLRQEMLNASNPPSPAPTTPWETTELQIPPTHPAINRLYALAATIYLHVVMSGAHPYLPEIRQAVGAVLATLKGQGNPQLLQSLSWPFCVSGCLATEDQYASFRQLFSATEAWDATNGTCAEAYRLMKACWTKRKTSDEDCDWASIMDQDGCFVLLR